MIPPSQVQKLQLLRGFGKAREDGAVGPKGARKAGHGNALRRPGHLLGWKFRPAKGWSLGTGWNE